MSYALLVPYSVAESDSAAALAQQAHTELGVEVWLAGPRGLGSPGGHWVEAEDRGTALRKGFAALSGRVDAVVLHDPRAPFSGDDVRALVKPIEEDVWDGVFTTGGGRGIGDVGLSALARTVTGVSLDDPFSGRSALRLSSVSHIALRETTDAVDAELLVKLSARQYRLGQVTVPSRGRGSATGWARARTLLRYLSVQNDADNAHEGYNTLARMETAPHYNAWLAGLFKPHLGQRVLEIGAGIGTITREIATGRELLIALEMDPFYVERLQNQFRGQPHVRPVLSGVEKADWQRLKGERIDSVVLSNVLEHIEDDYEAIRNFREVLKPGGKLVVLVPAGQALFGSMDEAVGHFRRYDKARLRRVMEEGGFELETLRPLNLVGIPGWFVNARLFKRRTMPPLQLRMFDAVAPYLARAEELLPLPLPVGLSLFAVGVAR